MTDLTHAERVDADRPATGDIAWHLEGNWAPVHDELDVADLTVEGQIPEALTGTYLRNGFNPRFANSGHWFFGHGMLHGVDLAEETARYRNRYVKTPYWEHDGSGIDWVLDRTCSPANTHVVHHAGRWLALEEQHLPYAVDEQLETLGLADFDGRLSGPFTAHPRVCPETGEMLAFGYDVMAESFVTYYRFSPEGKLVQVEPIEVPNPVMMHDWGVTRNHVVFMDLPVRFGFEEAADADMPFYFDEDAGARLGVMARDGSNADVRWYDIDPCYVFHPMSSFEDGDDIVLTVCRLNRAMAGGFDDIADKGRLWRWTIHTADGTVTEEQLDDRQCDFPRIDERRIGLPARYGYAAQLADNSQQPELGRELYKYDMTTGVAEVHHLGTDCHGGEPVFAPAAPDADEDDGWVLQFVHDEREDRSELRIISSRDFTGPPAARVFLPQRVPYGAHGSWLPTP